MSAIKGDIMALGKMLLGYGSERSLTKNIPINRQFIILPFFDI